MIKVVCPYCNSCKLVTHGKELYDIIDNGVSCCKCEACLKEFIVKSVYNGFEVIRKEEK